MSEKLSRDFSGYDTMDTAALEEILRQDAQAPVGAEADTELLLHIMEVLAERRRNANITGNTAQQAWESFQQNYMPHKSQSNQPGKARKAAPSWMRRLAAATAVIALVIIIPVSARAFSLGKLWDIIAKWAKETFSFVSSRDPAMSEPTPSDENAYSDLQELLLKEKVPVTIAPTWIPEGFKLEKVEKAVAPIQEIYRAFYLDGDRELKLRIQSYLNNHPAKIEINENLLEIYDVNGIAYYIFANQEQLHALWTVDSYECYIAGDLSIEEIKQMIDSIGKG